MSDILVRNALLPDAPQVHDLISRYSGDGTLLPRSLAEICENVHDFVVAIKNNQIIGCAALHIYGLNLAEIRSVAIYPLFQGHQAGSLLIDKLLHNAKIHNLGRVFLFTRVPGFFNRLGFTEVPAGLLPEKVHRDCMSCPRRHNCDEIAMVHGAVSAEELLYAKPIHEIIAARNGVTV
jgi:amino-acid N-acetyltransferase